MTDDASADRPAPKIDSSVPHSARIWNYWLGGQDNYQVDRDAGEEYKQQFPGIVVEARAARQFIIRTVRYLAADAGIRQFLDVGTGLPTADNTHEIAQRAAPESRIVYVDNDPLVLVHARALLTSTPEGATDYIDADLREPEKILEAATKTLDFTRPIALIMSGILGHISDDEDPHALVRRLVYGLPSGSYLMLQDSAATDEALKEAQEGYNESGAVSYNLRPPEFIAANFAGLDVIDPGVVPITEWRPDPAAIGRVTEVNILGAVAKKP